MCQINVMSQLFAPRERFGDSGWLPLWSERPMWIITKSHRPEIGQDDLQSPSTCPLLLTNNFFLVNIPLFIHITFLSDVFLLLTLLKVFEFIYAVIRKEFCLQCINVSIPVRTERKGGSVMTVQCFSRRLCQPHPYCDSTLLSCLVMSNYTVLTKNCIFIFGKHSNLNVDTKKNSVV